MQFKFKSEEADYIINACENHTFGGVKPICLSQLRKRLCLSAKEFREVVRYLKNIAISSISNGVVGCGLSYRSYLQSSYNAIKALDICNTVKMSARGST